MNFGNAPVMACENKMFQLMSQNWSSAKRGKLSQIKFKLTRGNLCKIKPLPITLTSETPIEDIHMIFVMLRIDHAYVTHHGDLTGIITTHAVLQASKLKPMETVP